jgi:two-component system, response regulator RegA
MRAKTPLPQIELPEDRSLLIVEDDEAYLQRLGRAMEALGFVVMGATTVPQAVALIQKQAPAFAVVDLRLGKRNGLDVIVKLLGVRPSTRAIVLTGYDSFTTAVFAIKLGAFDYLPKPVDADDVARALLAPSPTRPPTPMNFLSAKRVKWEHIHRVYELCNRKMTITAGLLAMHRRTLQSILKKRAPQ